MELSQELFKQIIAQLKGGGADSRDKRKRPRVGLRNHVPMGLVKDHHAVTPVSVVVRDLSQQGIGILHCRRVPVNSLFSIRLKATEAKDLVAVYRVKHCDMIDADLFRVGAALVDLRDFNEGPPDPAAQPAGEKVAAGC